MFSWIALLFVTVIYNPLYNLMVWLISVVPSHEVGFAVLALTVIVRIILIPLSRRAIQSQVDMRKVAPEITKLRDKHKDDKQAESKAIFELYKERGIHPFSGFFLTIIQIFIVYPIYWICSRAGLPKIDAGALYSFVHVPSVVNMEFLSLINMSGHSIVLALLAGVSQFTYTRLAMGPHGVKTATEASFSDDMARSMDTQARYVLPAIIAVIGYSIGAAAPLYWTTSNTFMIVQEYIAGRRFSDKV